MGAFVTGNTPLPARKVDARPPIIPEQEIDAADVNNLWDAAGDLRAHAAGWANVVEYGAVGDDFTDCTTAIGNAIATGKPVYFPAGTYRISGTITGQGSWRGEGQGNTYDSNAGAGFTIIRCVGANGGTPFIVPPKDMQGFHFDGIDKSGNGIVIGADNGTFTPFLRWRNITLRNFNIAIHGYNFFNVVFDNIVIQGNHEGIRIDPTVTTPDGGYFTSTDWRNVHIADNDVDGLYVNTPQLSKTWTWTNVVIERNGAGAGGSYQAFLQNVQLSANGLYVEGTPTKPGLQTNNISLVVTNGYFNGTGGINATSNTFRAFFSRVLMVTATDTITGLSSLSYMVVRDNSQLQTDVRATIGGRADVQFSTVPAGFLVRPRSENQTAPTYGTTITLDLKLGNLFQITPTDGVAFTITNTGPTQGQIVIVRVKNTFGVLGAATWTASFKMASAWTQPANGFSRSIIFFYDGAAFIELFRSAADVPN